MDPQHGLQRPLSFSPVLSNDRVIIPAAGGTLLVRDHADLPHGKVTRLAFYGLDNFEADPAVFASNVKINTPLRLTASAIFILAS
jgi:hypothetical protein